MKIHKIYIKNFKGIAESTFELNDHFTVFIGENATGKTTVLDALAVALGSFFLGIEGVNSRNISNDEIRIITVDGQPRPQKPVAIETHGEFDGIHIPPWKREISNKNTSYKNARSIGDVASKKLKESRKPKDQRDENAILFPLIAYHGTGRLWAEHEKVAYQKQDEGVIRAYTNALSAKSSSREFLSWFKTQEDSIKKFNEPLDIAHFKAFKEVILSLIPGQRWESMEYDFKADSLMGIFKDNEGVSCKLAYNQLSDGYRNLIGMAADIAYRCIQLNPHLLERAVVDTPGIVLIDELDLHLHPNWQKSIVADLKAAFPKIQFVATTHSPFIVQSLRADELINLDKPDDKTAPNELPLNKVVTGPMGVDGIRSDDFENRVKDAQVELSAIHAEKGELTLDDYRNISKALGKALIDETNDPEYKAYLLETEPNSKNETNK
jgi:predicted ATP-binding protein involved in virulence